MKKGGKNANIYYSWKISVIVSYCKLQSVDFGRACEKLMLIMNY